MSLPYLGSVGPIDRGVRILIGVVLIAIVFVGPQTPWGWIGIIPLATGLIGWCPLYRVLGFSTKSRPQNQ